ncbi:hypothetical protein TTHERM_00582300 (macronuclear) [Tetrahymena thermophila SB210]|uniref:Uncharacterized protein n=1 Tax=Tetrahymena thermophila (strain SB210) TaxID=312017 RepID=Q23Q60_TETTS|nr:hypothetical protein TTHERM_00582300 [Tetrahymena thermophila SB210]EAR98724.1 hypothetical protein TTHERM_00582300 [Tetrahymena thermophila SB210]|eukprot:XP_001018969.1 hypothetical protein TTHERM_00582300 [Tetrahymena thermophila SB210]
MYQESGQWSVSQEAQTIYQQEFDNLTQEQKIQKGLLITSKFIQGTLSSEEENIIIPDDLQSFTFQNIEVSPYPTQSKKVMKYVETDILQKFLNKNDFIQSNNIYSVIFVNMEDLSYHNFENILNLDYLFNNVKFQLKAVKTMKKQKLQLFKINGSTDVLLSLDKLNLYTQPLNNSQRGGNRLIFHSNQLSYSLTKMIQESKFFDLKNFRHVNNVFRLNNFAPGDKKFKSHYDTPFSDRSQKLYSKYTMLIYLTANKQINSNQPPLTIEDFVIDQIQENSCIIFDQKCKHEGNSYLDNHKIFIRTELIYLIEDQIQDNDVARVFNMACYMTKELNYQQYSADLFNKCVKMRYNIKQDDDNALEKVFLMKRNLEIIYITDGNYYWFPKHIPLQLIAILIILDYFNGRVYDLNNVKIQSKPINLKQQIQDGSDESIFKLLELTNFYDESIQVEKAQDLSKLNDFIPNNLCEDFDVFSHDCGKKSITSKSAFKFEKRKSINQLQSVFDQNPVLIFDNIIKINYSQIVIQKDDQISGKIKFNEIYLNSLNQINFASSYVECGCEQQYDEDDVVLFKDKKIHTFHLPNIPFQIFEKGIKLSIDIFNNGFIYHSTQSFEQPYTNEEELKQQNDESDENEDNESDENENNESNENEESESNENEDSEFSENEYTMEEEISSN